ncbi:hypothetical protein EIK77_006507 [Talaromyces pinophilus]|nr:hypothetical protein EIK77_006507 [Talaromyces pinophilus]
MEEFGSLYTNHADPYGGTPLSWAASQSQGAVVRPLLQNNHDVDWTDERERTALSLAASQGHEAVVRLLDKGADVNAKGGYYGNALQAAAREGCFVVVQLLLEKGVDVNIKGGDYGNALQAAAHGGHLGVTQLLLENGEDVNAEDWTDERERTTHSMAAANGNMLAVRCLLAMLIIPASRMSMAEHQAC